MQWRDASATSSCGHQTLPPWKPIFPLVLPQRWPTRPPLRLCGAPASCCAFELHKRPFALGQLVGRARLAAASTLSWFRPARHLGYLTGSMAARRLNSRFRLSSLASVGNITFLKFFTDD